MREKGEVYDFSNKSIFDVGIVPKRLSGQSLNLYYTELDAPHYQVASFEPAHVLKHYPGLKTSELKSLCVNTTDLNSFITQVTNDDHIALLSLDIEGIDAEVILDTDFKSMNVSLLSFEHLHLGSKLDECRSYVVECGFEYVGKGVDHNGYDYLYQKII